MSNFVEDEPKSCDFHSFDFVADGFPTRCVQVTAGAAPIRRKMSVFGSTFVLFFHFFLTTFQLCFNLFYWKSIPSSFISTDFVEIGLDYSAEISVFGGNSYIFLWFSFKIWINLLNFVNGFIHFHRKIRRLFGGKFPLIKISTFSFISLMKSKLMQWEKKTKQNWISWREKIPI